MAQSYLFHSGNGNNGARGGKIEVQDSKLELSAVSFTRDFPLGLHVAIIMDGNGRWATRRGLARTAGHHEGARAVERVVQAAPGLGVGTLTLFAFSRDNWQRPQDEVRALMDIFCDYLTGARGDCAANGIRVNLIGRRDRLGSPLRAAAETTERATADGRRMCLRIAIDYSGRDAILETARRFSQLREPAEELTREAFSRLMAEGINGDRPAPDVDLLIRTGGEQRLSDCLLWEIAYAEIVFSPRMWPDFQAADLEAAIAEFHQRQRRYGRVQEAAG